ncbi:MAG: hypothetical protein ABIQ01_03215 [Pseudolysinimonas sp.]
MAAKRTLVWGIVGVTSLALALPLGGMLASAAPVDPGPPAMSPVVVTRAESVSLRNSPAPADRGAAHEAQAPVIIPPPAKTGAVPPPPPPPPPPPAPAAPGCPQNASGSPVSTAPGAVSPGGVGGTTTDDLAQFALTFNAIRVGNCLPAVPLANFRYDSCMEQRLFWIAEDPSTDIASAWGHMGSVRSDGLPSVGCDGNLAGGMNNSSATFAQKWWDSVHHRASLYRPGETGLTSGVCVYFAMTHGGVPDEPYAFTRGAARWDGC